MPFKKTLSQAKKRAYWRNQKRSRVAAIKKFGEAAVKGKAVHHKDGNAGNTSPSNLKLKSSKAHGKMHGRGHGKLGKKNIKN